MNNLNITQEYTLCALDKDLTPKSLFLREVTKDSILYDYKYPICIVISIFYELLIRQVIKFDNRQKIIIAKEFNNDEEYLKIIYDCISSKKPKTLKSWVENIFLSFSKKNVENIVNSVIDSLVQKKFIYTENKEGIFNERVIYHIHKQQLSNIIEKVRSEILGKCPTSDKTIILTVLLYHSHILKNCFSIYERTQLDIRINEIKSSKDGIFLKNILDQIDAIIAVNIIPKVF